MEDIQLVNAQIEVGKEYKEVVDAICDLVEDIRIGKDVTSIAAENLQNLYSAVQGWDKIGREVEGAQVSESSAYLVDRIGDILGA